MPKRYPAGVTPVRDKLVSYLRKNKNAWVEHEALATYLYGEASRTTRKRCVALIRLLRKDGTTPFVIDTWHRGRTSLSYYRLRDRSLNGSEIIGNDADFLKTNWHDVQASTLRTSTDLKGDKESIRLEKSS